jgi:UV DNA damage endonuclease
MKLGFAVKVLGEGGLPSHDTRRWQSGPSLSVSIDCLWKVLDYLTSQGIGMYRMSSDFIPYGTHPDMPQFHGQIGKFRSRLSEIGAEARRRDIRLSLHPSQFVVLNAADPAVARKATEDLREQSELLDAMELGPEAVVVTHVGGVYGNKEESLKRFIANWKRLPEPARRRVVVENDERSFCVADIVGIHSQTGTSLIFDYLHHMLNPCTLDLRAALDACLATWPTGVTPKIHFSSPRTEMRPIERKNRTTGKREITYSPPLISQHSDYINPLEFQMFQSTVGAPTYDIMLEAKAKDLALIELRAFLYTHSASNTTNVCSPP